MKNKPVKPNRMSTVMISSLNQYRTNVINTQVSHGFKVSAIMFRPNIIVILELENGHKLSLFQNYPATTKLQF